MTKSMLLKRPMLLKKIIENSNGVAYLKIVFVDIAKFSKRRTIAQISILNNFTNLLKEAINRVEIQSLEICKRYNYNFSRDIIKIPTGDGILLAMPFEGLVRPHLDFSIELLKLISESNKYEPCSEFDAKGWCDCHNYFDIRIGIDEGKALVYKDLNDNYNVAGDVIYNAQRIMAAGSEKTILMGQKAYYNLTQFDLKIINDFNSPKWITDKHGNHMQVYHYCPKNVAYINSSVSNKIIETNDTIDDAFLSPKKPLNNVISYKKGEDNPFEYDVFLCHSSKDKPIIEDLIKDLKMEGITYWVDAERIDYGDPITQKIEEGLQRSRYIIPCLSMNQKISGWTRAEYGAVLNAEFSGKSKRTVIPLKLDNCEEDDIPLFLMDKKRVTYSDKTDFNRFIKSLKNRKNW